MKKLLTYRPYCAGLLAFMLLFSISLKEMHHITGHAHESTNECQAAGNDVHVHDDSYHYHHCFLCHFSFSELNYGLTDLLPEPVELIVAKISLPDPVNYSFFYYKIPLLRGPPMS